MKSAIWTIVIGIVLVSAISTYSAITVTNITDQYLEIVDALEQMVKKDEMEKAAPLALSLHRQWVEDCQSLQFIAIHSDTDKVDSYIYMLEAGFETEDKVTILWALHELSESLESIAQREELTLVNIF